MKRLHDFAADAAAGAGRRERLPGRQAEATRCEAGPGGDADGGRRGEAFPIQAVDVPCGVFVLDRHGRVVRANGAGLALLRRARRTSAAGLHLAAQMHPSERRRFGTFFAALLTGRPVEPGDFWLRPRKSPPRCVQLMAVPYPRGCAVAAVDVTARKRAELELRRRNEELVRTAEEHASELRASLEAIARREREVAGLLNAVMDAVVVVTADGRIARVNAAAEQVFGWPAARVTGEPVALLVPPRQRLVLRQDLRRAAVNGRLQVNAIPPRIAMRADGTEFPMEISFARSSVGGNGGLLIVVRDISERMEALRGLVENWRTLVDFFDSAPIGLLWVDPGGEVERVNAAHLEILGRERGEVLHHRVAELHTDPAGMEEVLAGVAAGRIIRNRRAQVRRPDGSLRHVLVDANGGWRDGRLTMIRCFVRDITHSVDLEREILAIAEREQQRIGHELHDDVCQQLTAIEFMSESLAGRLASAVPRAARDLREISALIRAASRHTREISRGLSLHAVFLRGGLAAALQDFALRVRKSYHASCRLVDHCGVGVTDPALCANLFRIAQEAVANAVRHGGARRIELRLEAAGRDLVMSIRNDGRPLPAGASAGRGMGLRIMQYRAGVVGGRIDFRSRRRGVELVCTVTDALAPSPR